MKLRTLSAIALVVSAVHASPSMAFGLPSIPGISGSNSAPSLNVDALSTQQTQLLTSMAVSLLNLSKAQAMMFRALGDDERAQAAQHTADSLSGGTLTGKDDMKKALDSSLDLNDYAKKDIAKAGTLSGESKAMFAKSLVPYGVGTAGLVNAGKKAAEAGQSLTHTIDPTILFKLSSLLYVAKEAPTLMSAFGSTTSQLVTYATSQGIDTSAIKVAGASMGD
ncbi:conserved exported hypothetical protein [Burkholderia sp. 8Y]|uniref:hypothetical protein n=1 Tax=Burkholderia sp. 8Y TaxID=2653133 RepID=UPI0012F04B26|nr:hypothetical protein [Burkholderia sp. 8Y]VXB36287.1 conserved exported hypothetical protein [Burkholderia sp. 8Y]